MPPTNLLSSPASSSCVSWSQNCVVGFTWLSGCLSFLIILTELNRKKFRTFPTNMPLIFATVALAFNCTLGIGPTLSFRQVTEFDTDPVFANFCRGQAFLYQLGGAATLFWYFALTNIMYKIIVQNIRVVDLQEKAKRYYLGGLFFPLLSATIPAIAGVYGPRKSGFPIIDGKQEGLECWVDDPFWQFGLMYFWVFIAAFWGMYRSYFILRTLRKTTYKTKRSQTNGAMASSRGRTVLSTLHEHMLRQVAFVTLYCVFTVINLLYFTWSFVLYEEAPDVDDVPNYPCVLTLMYAINTSLIGTYITIVFGATKENIKAAKNCARQLFMSANGDGSENSEWTNSDLTSPLQQGGNTPETEVRIDQTGLDGLRNDLEIGLGAGQQRKGSTPGVSRVSHGDRQERIKNKLANRPASTVTTHLGTKINAKLGIINSPALDCTSAFGDGAVSGMSVPPANHPLTAKLEAMRDKYTKNVLTYVLERIEVLALDETVAMEFMDEIETESHMLFDASVLENKYSTVDGGRAGSIDANYDCFVEGQDENLLPTVDDIDARLKKAKEKFEGLLRQKSTDNA